MVGPTMRLALLAPTSNDMAVLIWPPPTTSPIITRRTGLSVAQPSPFRKLATARCQIARRPPYASNASEADVISISMTTMIRLTRRSSFSAQAPINAPNSPIGSSRSMVVMATRKADPLCW